METYFESFKRPQQARSEWPTVLPCDWQGLRARFGAALATRRLLLGESGHSVAKHGSFAPDAAQILASQSNHFTAVNLTALADGKQRAGKEHNDAAAHRPGGRGL